MIQFFSEGMRMMNSITYVNVLKMHLYWTSICIRQPSVSFSASFGDHLKYKQLFTEPDPAKWDYEYIEYYKKAMANSTDSTQRSQYLDHIQANETYRDFYTQSLRHINHLIQIDEKPNLELKEPRSEIYKISLSFRPQSKS